MATPRHIDRRRAPNSASVVGSYSSTAQSYTDTNSRRMSTARLSSPIFNELESSPRARSTFMNDNGPSGLRNDAMSITSAGGTPPPRVLVDVENPSFQSGQKEENVINSTTSQYFNNGLTSEGGDITHHMKKKSNSSSIHPLKKVRSTSDLYNERRSSTASALNVPGGFRREFIVNKARERAILNDEELKQVPFLTKNFMEFLYIYGHFAGEDFEDDFFAMSSNGSVAIDEDSPLLETQNLKEYQAKGTTSTMKAFLIMLKSFIGTGIIFLPKGFANGGLFFSLGMLSVFGVYSYYCYYILVQSKNATNVSSFGDIGSKLYGGWMKNLILFSLALTQIGFSCAYIIFTSENLGAFVRNVTGWDLGPQWFFILQSLIFIPLSFIRNVAKLSFPALIANGFIFMGLIIIVFFISKELIFNGAKPVNLWINESKFSLFIGTAIFAFEGIGLIIPIQDSMRYPEKFPIVLGLVIVTITILMNLVAVIGYLAYGENTNTAILLNLPQSNIFVNFIQFFYSLAILLSTPLQIFPAIAIIEKKIFGSSTGKNNTKVKWSKNILRTVFVLLLINIAWFGANDLDKFVSFVGCFACIPLVYMYPPLLHLKSCVAKSDIKGKILDIALVVIGLASMLYTSYQIIFGAV